MEGHIWEEHLKRFGKEVKHFRLGRNDTQEDFARAFGISANTLSLIENGKASFNMVLFEALERNKRYDGFLMLMRAFYGDELPAEVGAHDHNMNVFTKLLLEENSKHHKRRCENDTERVTKKQPASARPDLELVCGMDSYQTLLSPYKGCANKLKELFAQREMTNASIVLEARRDEKLYNSATLVKNLMMNNRLQVDVAMDMLGIEAHVKDEIKRLLGLW